MYLHFYSIVPFDNLSFIYYKFGGLSLAFIKNKQELIYLNLYIFRFSY